MIAYISEQGAKIGREGERLIVSGKEGRRPLLVKDLDQLVLLGAVHMTAQARSLLLSKRKPVFFLSSSGHYAGKLEVDEGENIFLRKRQFELQSDLAFQLSAAKEIVKAKLHNQAAMLSRIITRRKITSIIDSHSRLKGLIGEVRAAETVASLRGIEGGGAEIYFHGLRRAFIDDMGFTRRARRPPTDPVNAVLSLLYTLLINRCHIACRLAGLDPYLGNLHSLEYGRHSLPLDLVEEFRSMCADALALSLFNHHILKKDDFIMNDPNFTEPDQAPGAPQAVYLEKQALKKALAAFAEKMDTTFRHPQTHKETSYNEAVIIQARAYREVVEGKEEKYRPIYWY